MTDRLDTQMADFLYWHAVSKMRMANFEDACVLFGLLQELLPERTEAALGHIYCLVRLGRQKHAAGLIMSLRRHALVPIEVALLGRLQRRCEFDQARSASLGSVPGGVSSRHAREASQLRMPHTLGDDEMARLAAEQL